MVRGVPARLWVIAGVGLLARVIAGACSGGAFDYWAHRLPIARCLDAGRPLYCDCKCNHMPVYPYLSLVMLRLSPDIDWIRAALLTLPAAVGDALVPLALYALLNQLGKRQLALPAASLYALNPITIYEVRLAHWDGLTSLAMLLSLHALGAGSIKTSGALAGLGAALKQFPGMVPAIVAFKERRLRPVVVSAVTAAAVIGLVLAPSLLSCPQALFTSLAGHPLWQGDAPEGVGVGTVRQLFEHLNVPEPRLVWLVAFLAVIGVGVIRAERSNYFYLTGFLLVMLAYFTYATHRQLVVWALPFMIALSLEDKSYWALLLAAAGYLIRLLKPAWYFGLVHLVAGVWYVVAFARAMAVQPSSVSPESGSAHARS